MQVFDSWIDAGLGMSDEDRVQYYAALLEYLKYGKEPNTSGTAKAVLTAIMPALKKARGNENTERKPQKKRYRRPINNKLRFDVLFRDGFTCQYCGRKPPEVELEVDHMFPVAAGGTNEISNLIASCRECNSGKGAQIID